MQPKMKTHFINAKLMPVEPFCAHCVTGISVLGPAIDRKYIVHGRVVFSDVVRGDLRSSINKLNE
jgi:hypothetical protein